MTTGRTLNAANLETLGAARLAALLLAISAGDAAVKRPLRLALAGEAGSGEAAREVAKRLASIAKARSFIDWQKVSRSPRTSKRSGKPFSTWSPRPIPRGVRLGLATGGLRGERVRTQRRRQRASR